jgi:hypothetical protein
MRVSNFSVLVQPSSERDSSHVEMTHGQVYKIKLGNHDHRRCDAEVKVDGKSVGAFRVNGCDSIVLERPSHTTGCFTFYRVDSQEAQSANLSGVSRDDLGLVQVIFRPEKVPYRPEPAVTMGMFSEKMIGSERSFVPCGRSAGGTGLSGRSDQQFHSVAELDYDQSQVVTISLRLVCGSGVRELTPATRGNSVPTPV